MYGTQKHAAAMSQTFGRHASPIDVATPMKPKIASIAALNSGSAMW